MVSTDQSDFFSSLVWNGSGSPPSEPQSDSGSEPVLKQCGRCRENLPIENFYTDNTRKDGHNNSCKSCIQKYNATYSKKRRAEPEETTMEPESSSDTLYIMSISLLPGMIKIGRSNNPEERAKQLGTSLPFRLTVERSYSGKGFLERTLHCLLYTSDAADDLRV